MKQKGMAVYEIKTKKVDYSKWGYIFILPFFVSFFVFSFIPLVDTIRYSFLNITVQELKRSDRILSEWKIISAFWVRIC